MLKLMGKQTFTILHSKKKGGLSKQELVAQNAIDLSEPGKLIAIGPFQWYTLECVQQ